MYVFLDTLIQGMLVIEGIKSLLLAIALLLEESGDLEKQKNKILCLAQVLKLSIESWLIRYARWCGLQNLLMVFGFRQPGLMPMHCDNQSAICIAQNLVFHERTKHIKIDCQTTNPQWLPLVY